MQAALGIADLEGLSALSMQRIASEFGFTTMSLYRYVPGKAQLIDLMTDAAIGTPPALDDVPGGWRPKLEWWARQLWSTYHKHPWMFELPVAHPETMGPNELNWLEAAVSSFSGTDLTGAEQLDAIFALSGLVRSWMYRSSSREKDPPQQPITAEVTARWSSVVGRLVREHSDNYPALMMAMHSGAFDPNSGDGGEEFGLRCVLDGIGVLIEKRAKEALTP